MPTRTEAPLDPAERRRQIASVLAKGVIRWCRRVKATEISAAQESRQNSETRLELSGETPLSVGTRGFTPRSDGDER